MTCAHHTCTALDRSSWTELSGTHRIMIFWLPTTCRRAVCESTTDGRQLVQAGHKLKRDGQTRDTNLGIPAAHPVRRDKKRTAIARRPVLVHSQAWCASCSREHRCTKVAQCCYKCHDNSTMSYAGLNVRCKDAIAVASIVQRNLGQRCAHGGV